MKSKKEIKQLAEEEYWMKDEKYERGAYIKSHIKCQEDITNEIQSLIDMYNSDILLLEEEFRDSSSVLIVEKMVTLADVIHNLYKIINK